MPTSSDSESEDERMKLFLEATDTSLLTDSMYNADVKPAKEVPVPADLPQSQRHLQDDDQNAIDFVPPEAVQKLMSKRLALLVQKQIEFVPDIELNDATKRPKRKSKVKLLRDSECYVKSYEDFEYSVAGPQKKPKIKRRNVDKDEQEEDTMIKLSVIDGDFILSQKETQNWSNKSKGKVFSYKRSGGAKNVHHAVEPVTEFTKLRRKNNWNESKIKSAKFPKK